MSKWASIEDGLPVGEDHLLVYEAAEGSFMCVGYWNRLRQGWIVNGEAHEGLIVTHWMPLPAAPTTGESK